MVHLKLPEAQKGGLAPIIQGLGLLALLLVLLSGIIWFISWEEGWFFLHSVQELHKSLTTFAEIYLVGHGIMAIIHFLCSKYFPRLIAQK